MTVSRSTLQPVSLHSYFRARRALDFSLAIDIRISARTETLAWVTTAAGRQARDGEDVRRSAKPGLLTCR